MHLPRCCIVAAVALSACGGQAGPGEPFSAEADRMKIELGKDLFSDKRLSADKTISCASCHDVAAGGDDGLKTAVGVGGRIGPINTPTVINSSLNSAQFWDGRARTLEEQVHGPITNPLEMGESWAPALARLAADRKTRRRFSAVYTDGLSAENIADAIAAYERELLTLDSPFDRYQGGQEFAISREAAEGFVLFQRFGCISCHQGRAFGGNLYERFGVLDDYFAWRGTPVTGADLGRFNVTGREEDRHRFKVPGLRNAALTSPYFHDGSVQDLGDAVRLMARFQVGRAVSEVQVSRIVSFLESLTGEVREDLR